MSEQKRNSESDKPTSQPSPPFQHLYEQLEYTTWDELVQKYQSQRDEWAGWVYRGQERACWDLRTRLERAVERFTEQANDEFAFEKELGMIREFCRKAHHFLPKVPNEKSERIDVLAWLQHYGAPTRLLDWTYSFYLAAFFAIEKVKPEEACSIWALDAQEWKEHAKQKLEKEGFGVFSDDRLMNYVLWKPKQCSMVYPLVPYELHSRLVTQQSVFLAAGDIRKSFMTNLDEMGLSDSKKQLIKIDVRLDKEELRTALKDLDDMNINRASLFPGIDGFVGQLENQMMIPERLYVSDQDAYWGL